jgi:hypothetical protein
MGIRFQQQKRKKKKKEETKNDNNDSTNERGSEENRESYLFYGKNVFGRTHRPAFSSRHIQMTFSDESQCIV